MMTNPIVSEALDAWYLLGCEMDCSDAEDEMHESLREAWSRTDDAMKKLRLAFEVDANTPEQVTP